VKRVHVKESSMGRWYLLGSISGIGIYCCTDRSRNAIPKGKKAR
jgi:hypothetical protein